MIKESVTIPVLQAMKREARKIVVVVAWDFQIAQIADRAGVEIVSVGDSVGVNLWGHSDPFEVTLDEMIIVSKAVRRGTRRALVSCDLPLALLRRGVESVVRGAMRVVDEAGVDMVKLDTAAGFPDAVAAVVHAGIPVFAEFQLDSEPTDKSISNLIAHAKHLEDSGASFIDFKFSGPIAGPAVVNAVSIPVLGGLGGGPWLDGRIRMAHAAIGYAASMLESNVESYANVAEITLRALNAYANDVRAGRQINGGR